MGFGDSLMAIGDAWVKSRGNDGRKVAIGDGTNLTDVGDLAYGLDFLANQTDVETGDVDWVYSSTGERPYIDYTAMRNAARMRGIVTAKNRKLVGILGRYIWNDNYRANPAPYVPTRQEAAMSRLWRLRGPFVLVEPYLKTNAPVSKQYSVDRMRQIALALAKEIPVYQISAPAFPDLDPAIPRILTHSFREALAYMEAASLYIGPEGGLHHGAAATMTRAVVLFGGYIPPHVTGYDFHVNMTGGSTRSCGIKSGCSHCAAALNNISVDDVLRAARNQIEFEYAS